MEIKINPIQKLVKEKLEESRPSLKKIWKAMIIQAVIPSIVIIGIGSSKAPKPRMQHIKKLKSNKNIIFFLRLAFETLIHSKNNASDNKNTKVFKIRFGEKRTNATTTAERQIAVIERCTNSCLSPLTESSLRIKIFFNVSFKILF